MNFVYIFLSIWLCSFVIARLFNVIGGGKWSPFGKTNWRNDFIITMAQSLIISFIFIFIF